MSNNLSYSYRNSYPGQKANQQAQGKTASEGQRQLYYKMCMERSITPKAIDALSYDEMDALIKEAQKFRPVSPKQIETMKNMYAQLVEVGIRDKIPTTEMIQALGATNASKAIGNVIEVLKQNSHLLKPTEPQIEQIVNMYMCPDIPWETYGLERKIMMDSYNEKSGEQEWKALLPKEFADQVMEKMTREQASQMMSDYSNVFYDWRKTRLSQGKEEFIRTLEGRLADLYVPKRVEPASGIDGVSVSDEFKQIATTKVYDEESAYDPLPEYQMAQFSDEEASAYITQLQWELNFFKSSGYQDESENHFENIRYTAVDEDGNSMNYKQQHDFEEFHHINEMMHRLQAVVGEENEHIDHEKLRILFNNGCPDLALEMKKELNEYMSYLMKEKLVDGATLFEMCGESDIAIEILFGTF